MSLVNVILDSETMKEMLSDRVNEWREGEEAELFCKMYDSMVDNGVFDESEFDVKSIVDNDIVNWCSVIEPSNKDFKTLLRLYKKGERDISRLNLKEVGGSYIEEVSDNEDLILVRY